MMRRICRQRSSVMTALHHRGWASSQRPYVGDNNHELPALDRKPDPREGGALLKPLHVIKQQCIIICGRGDRDEKDHHRSHRCSADRYASCRHPRLLRHTLPQPSACSSPTGGAAIRSACALAHVGGICRTQAATEDLGSEGELTWTFVATPLTRLPSRRVPAVSPSSRY